jgi:Asp/Glu/hydantoin racemase
MSYFENSKTHENTGIPIIDGPAARSNRLIGMKFTKLKTAKLAGSRSL